MNAGNRQKMDELLPYLSKNLAAILGKADFTQSSFPEEIRLRANKPLMVLNYKKDWFISGKGELTQRQEDAYIVKQLDIKETLELVSENSVYAYQEEIRNGYITINGGHRIGISGKVLSDGLTVKNIRDISGLNIRIANAFPGCSKKIIRHIISGPSRVFNTLIVSPPQCGKTTILRDIARSISNGVPELGFEGKKVGIVDERSEIAAYYKGSPQNDVGIRTDVLDSCPKRLGMAMLIRSMSPQVIITDEIGDEGDREAIMSVLNAGIKLITTAHGYNISELRSRREVLRLIEDKVFERYIVLGKQKGPGTVVEVIDGNTMKPLALGV